MREIDQAESFTSRRLAVLSSLFKHLVRHGHAEANPVAEVEHPAINRREGSTLTLSKGDAARLLNEPAEGLRDRAILSVGLQVGLCRGDERVLGSVLIKLTIVLSATRRNSVQVFRDAAAAYKMDTDAVALKVKQEFAAKERARVARRHPPKPRPTS